jgi:hypothetical protein
MDDLIVIRRILGVATFSALALVGLLGLVVPFVRGFFGRR